MNNAKSIINSYLRYFKVVKEISVIILYGIIESNVREKNGEMIKRKREKRKREKEEKKNEEA